MTSYRCPFCGEDVNKEEILFCSTVSPEYYEDSVHFRFLTSCYSQYPLENGALFRGLYFRPTVDTVRARDKNGYPLEVEVQLCDGLAPLELSGTIDSFDLEPLNKPADQSKIKLASRACPHCHCRLPQDFGLIPTVTVSLLGGRASGKTAFLIAMIQQLNDQLALNQLGSVELLPESRVYMEPQIRFFEEHNGTTMPTPNQRLFPLVFQYVNALGSERTSCFVVIYDIAGEVINNRDVNSIANHQGVREATIFLLVIDPNQFNNGSYYVAAQRNRNDAPVSTIDQHDFFADKINTFIQQMTVCSNATDNIQHVITVLTKMDYPLEIDRNLFGDHANNCLVKRGMGNIHSRGVHLGALRRIDYELDKLFRQKLNNIDIKEQIRNVFNHNRNAGDSSSVDVSLLGVSTYTQKMENDRIVYVNDSSATAAKHRIIEPFLKILVLADMVPVKNPAPGQKPSEKGRR